MKKIFKLDIQSLDKLFDFIAAFVNKAGLDSQVHFQIDLVVEELFSNMVKYDGKVDGDMELELKMHDGDLLIILTDFNVEPFDPTKSKNYNVSQNIENRPIGKIGVHLVNEIADKIEYKYENNNNVLKLIKHIGSTNVRN
jgi:anti-sigma regulatory factor (Ser/Thr protein kinase)